jgi:hypothetical protein
VDRSVAPAAYFIARINHESKGFLRPNCGFLDLSSFCFCVRSCGTSRPRLCSVEERPFRAVKRNPGDSPSLRRRPGAPDTCGFHVAGWRSARSAAERAKSFLAPQPVLSDQA